VTGCRVTVDGLLTHLRLDGTRHNALGDARYAQVREVASQLGQDEVLLLSAEGPDFCAGQDLVEFEDARAAGQLGEVLRRGSDAILAVLESRATVVAAVQGAAVGAGALLAAAADLVLLGPSARFRLPELSLGLPLGASVADRLVGPRASRRMMLAGDWMTVEQVLALGGARLCAEDGLLSESLAVCHSMLSAGAEARAVARSLFGSGERAAAAGAYRDEIEATLALFARDGR
jgi:enoyl-CoA hydratase/carnithine racemase